jgi:hypothetical protein
MIDSERNTIISQVKFIREMSFKLSDALLHAKEAESKGLEKPSLEVAQSFARALRDTGLAVANRLSNESSL